MIALLMVKLIVCGNGGSVDSQHFVAELVSKFAFVNRYLQ